MSATPVSFEKYLTDRRVPPENYDAMPPADQHIWIKRYDDYIALMSSAETESNAAAECKHPASRFVDTTAFSHVALPTGLESYFPRIPLLQNIVDDVKTNGAVNECMLESLVEYRSALTFKPPSDAEEYYCLQNLKSLMDSISSSCDDRKLFIMEAQVVQGYVPLSAAKNSSYMPVLVCKASDRFVGFICSQAKPLMASMYCCMAQAIQISSDCALHLCKMYPSAFHCSSVVVPFILASWEGYQFGCVYLVENSFPCATLLSRVLNQSVPSDQAEICRWGMALANHCNRMKLMISSLSYEKDGFNSSKLELQRDAFFFKIVKAEGFFARSCLAHVMSVFHRLDTIPDADKTSVLFPAGVIGLPCQEFQSKLLKYVVNELKKFPRSEIRTEADIPSAGHPIVLYRKLDPAIWQLTENIEYQTDYVKRAFLSELTRLLNVFVSVGVIHMDIRASNIFYRVLNRDTVQIVVIDWDDALMLNALIPRYLHARDRSMPIPAEHVYATAEVHQYLIDQIRETIKYQHVSKKRR